MDIDRTYCEINCKGWQEIHRCFCDGVCASYRLNNKDYGK